MCHHKWHIADLSHSSTVYTLHITYVIFFPQLFSKPSLCFLVLFGSQPLNLSLFLLFMRPRFHSGHMFWRSHAYSHTHAHKHTHIHELVFSLCPYALCAVVLLLCCSQTGLFTAAWQQDRSSHPPNWAAPNQLHTPHMHTHIHNGPFSHKATAAGVLLMAPLWL